MKFPPRIGELYVRSISQNFGLWRGYDVVVILSVDDQSVVALLHSFDQGDSRVERLNHYDWGALRTCMTLV